jgi:hypothetical protein
MIRSSVLAAGLMALVSMPAFASYPPIKYSATRADIASRCEALGAQGQGWGLEGDFGAYGCRNTANGNTVKCSTDGHCTDYSGDARWSTVKRLFENNGISLQPPRRV